MPNETGSPVFIQLGKGLGNVFCTYRDGVLGDLDTEAHVGAVDDVTPQMGYNKQTIALLLQIIASGGVDTAPMMAVLGALDDSAASGPVTDTDTITSYQKQLVTAAIAAATSLATIISQTDHIEDVIGALDTAAATGAVSNAKLAMAYLKQIVTLKNAADLVQASILEDTGTTIPATISTIDGIVDSILEDTGTTLPATLTAINNAITTLQACISGAAGIATWLAAAAPGNGVSLHEVIRQLYNDIRGGGVWPGGDHPANAPGIMAALYYEMDAVRKNGGAALAASKSLVDAVGSNGSALAYGSGSILGAIGTQIVVNSGSQLVSNEIKMAPAKELVDSIDGTVYVEEIILDTGLVGLAAGTDIIIKTTSLYGPTVIMQEAVANLGANKRIKATEASVIAMVPFTMDEGDTLTIESTNYNCTGNGILRLTFVAKRESEGAQLQISTLL